MNRLCRFWIVAILLTATALGSNAFDLVYSYMPYFKLEQFKGVNEGTRQISTNFGEMNDCNVNFRFDDNGRLLVKEHGGILAGWASIEYFTWETVDGVDRVKESKTESHGSDVSFGHVASRYFYDNQGRLEKIVSESKTSCPPDFMFANQGKTVTTFKYDDEDRIVSIESVTDGEEPDVCRIEYIYYDGGNIRSATKENSGNRWFQQYRYNDEGLRVSEKQVDTCWDVTDVKVHEYLYASDGVGKEMIVRKDCDIFAPEDTDLITMDNKPGGMLMDVDALNPYGEWNSGDERYVDFLKKFSADKKFRTERSVGMLMNCSAEVTPYSVCLSYPQTGSKGLNVSNDVAKQMFATLLCSPEMLCVETFTSKGPIFYSRFVDMSKDMVVAEISEYNRKTQDRVYHLYFFARKDGKWYLVGRSAEFDPW